MADQGPSINQLPLQEGVFSPRYRTDFSGGINLYLGARQIADNESPNSTDCDFIGSTGVGNRQGYKQVGTVTNGLVNGRGLAEYHNATQDQLVALADDGSTCKLKYCNGNTTDTWTVVSSVTLTSGYDVNLVQAGVATLASGVLASETQKLYTFNGQDGMCTWDGTTFASYAAGKKLLYGAYFDKRLWGLDPTNTDTLWFSVQSDDATQPLSFTTNGTSTSFGTFTINVGAGIKITGIKMFKNSLYVWTQSAIYQLSATATANTYSLTLVTASIGCVSHRSIQVVENDVYFATDYGVFSLGEVGTFSSVRATNKSLKVQRLSDALTGATKQLLVGGYFNYKYHLFYSLYGTNNDSCVPYDIRYNGWQDWRSMAANQCCTMRQADRTLKFYFINPINGKVFQMYNGTTNDGTAFTSTWYSKSFDEGQFDTEKLYFDSSFLFGLLTGSVTVTVIFNDNEISSPVTITQGVPQGGFGRDALGKKALGRSSNTVTVTQLINSPQRLKAKGQKFAVQYLITSTGSWRLDAVSQFLQIFPHFKFPSGNKLN